MFLFITCYHTRYQMVIKTIVDPWSGDSSSIFISFDKTAYHYYEDRYSVYYSVKIG